jgi:hypothetical protein
MWGKMGRTHQQVEHLEGLLRHVTMITSLDTLHTIFIHIQ